MARSPYGSGKYALGICDVCGFRCMLNDMQYVQLVERGAPSLKPTNIKVCPECKDAAQPSSMLPIVIKNWGQDAQQLKDPRPDIYPVAFPVTLTPNTIQHGTTAQVRARGMFGGYTATASSDAGITPTVLSLITPSQAIMNISVAANAQLGVHLVTITDGQGNNLVAQLNVN